MFYVLGSCNIEKSYLVDVKTKLYIATDSNPVDVHTYELCSDLIDVVVDVSYIYGVRSTTSNTGNNGKSTGNASTNNSNNNSSSNNNINHHNQSNPYDHESASAIRLDSGMVLYLREVSDLLALVCVLRDEYYSKRSVLDYNIDCLKNSLEKVMRAGKGGVVVGGGEAK